MKYFDSNRKLFRRDVAPSARNYVTQMSLQECISEDEKGFALFLIGSAITRVGIKSQKVLESLYGVYIFL